MSGRTSAPKIAYRGFGENESLLLVGAAPSLASGVRPFADQASGPASGKRTGMLAHRAGGGAGGGLLSDNGAGMLSNGRRLGGKPLHAANAASAGPGAADARKGFKRPRPLESLSGNC